jgi:hypothetical protein
MGLSFTIAAGSRQSSHFQVRVQRDSRPHITVSDSSHPQSGGPGPRIYIPPRNRVAWLQSQAVLPFRRLLNLSLTLRPTVSRPICLGIKHQSGAYDNIFITVKTVAGLLMWGALSDDRTGLSFTIAAGPSQRSHSGPRPVGLATIFYCLRFETSLFVASYDSQGYGGGIDPASTREFVASSSDFWL